MRKLILLAAVAVALFPGRAPADGEFHAESKGVPPDLPCRRALIAHDGSRKLLITVNVY